MISLVVPVYNEAENIQGFLADVEAAVRRIASRELASGDRIEFASRRTIFATEGDCRTWLDSNNSSECWDPITSEL